MEKNYNIIINSESTKEMRALADDLRERENAIICEWQSASDRYKFADILEKVAELKELCPTVQGCFAFESEVKGNVFSCRSPILVVSSTPVYSDIKSDEEEKANKYAVCCELIAKQAKAIEKEVGQPVEEILATASAAAFATRKPKLNDEKRMEHRLRVLASVMPVIDGLVNIKQEVVLAIMSLVLKAGMSDDSKDSEDEDSSKVDDEADSDDNKKCESY